MSEPPDARRARNDHFARVLGVPTRVLLVLAIAATVVPGRVGVVSADAAVVAVVAVPLVRVAWLARRWWGRGDRRFASAALALLGIVGCGAAVAFWT